MRCGSSLLSLHSSFLSLREAWVWVSLDFWLPSCNPPDFKKLNTSPSALSYPKLSNANFLLLLAVELDFYCTFDSKSLLPDPGALEKWERTWEYPTPIMALMFIQGHCLGALMFYFSFSEGITLKVFLFKN